MKIHEYQAKLIAEQTGVPVPKGQVAFNVQDVERIVKELELDTVVLKAQVHAGGRGKAGGIQVVPSQDAGSAAKALFGKKLVTPQTGDQGKIVNRILVTDVCPIQDEYYVSIVLDRSLGKLILMVSPEGGVEIEKVAQATPEKILKIELDRATGLMPFQARQAAFFLGLQGTLFKQCVKTLMALADAYDRFDCSLIEINPLVSTTNDKLLALDLKINIDDNALYRHPDIAEMRDKAEEEPLEIEASEYHLNYIKLDGTVGCMVNGAGLAMATMDLIKLAGAEPANFLDVGGAASAETVEHGFRIILSDPNVQAILVNIFGGIVRCDRVANGVVQAAEKLQLDKPLVVRLAGTNAEMAKSILDESGLQIYAAEDMKQAADHIVNLLGRD